MQHVFNYRINFFSHVKSKINFSFKPYERFKNESSVELLKILIFFYESSYNKKVNVIFFFRMS